MGCDSPWGEEVEGRQGLADHGLLCAKFPACASQAQCRRGGAEAHCAMSDSNCSLAVLSAILLLGSAAGLTAGTHTWKGGSGQNYWTDNANWVEGQSPD